MHLRKEPSKLFFRVTACTKPIAKPLFTARISTCFDHNSSKSTNFSATDISWKRSRGAVTVGELLIRIGCYFLLWKWRWKWKWNGERPAGTATTHHSFPGSSSAVSTPMLVRRYSVFSIFHNLQDCHTFATARIRKSQQHFVKLFFLNLLGSLRL